MATTNTDPRAAFSALLDIIAGHLVGAALETGRTNTPESLASAAFELGRNICRARPEILAAPEEFEAQIGTLIRQEMARA